MKIKLSKESITLLTIGCLFNAGLTIASTFVNVYLIRLTNNMGLMILQNIANYLMIISGFVLGTRLTKKGISMLSLLRIGITAVISYYAHVLLLKENAGNYLILLGLCNGIGQGFYYFTFNILIGKLLKNEEQSKFFSYQSSFGYFFGVLAPTISGYIIVKFTELTGYYVLFGTAVLVFVLAIIFSIKLKKVQVTESYSLLPVLKERGNKHWNLLKFISFTFGAKEVIYYQIFTVFAYLIISNEATIGNLTSISSLIGVLSSLLIASKFTSKTQKKYHFMYCIGYAISLGCLGLFATPFALKASFIINGLVFSWCNVIYSTHIYQLAKKAATKYTNSDYIIVCEFPLAAGRILGLFIFYILNLMIDSFTLYRILLIAITILPFIDHHVINKKVNWNIN
jgi:YQGE family putative transporter